MANYTVAYACTHGSREVQLYGPNKERARKIEWMERTVQCPACTKADRIAEDNAKPRTADIHISTTPMVISVALNGQIEANKAALVELGWGWSNDAVGALGLLATRPEWRFVRHWSYRDAASLNAAVTSVIAALAEIGWTAQAPSSLDVSMALHVLGERDKAKAANPRPARPEWWKALLSNGVTSLRCNRTIYGRGADRHIYVNNNKISLTSAQIAEIEAYWSALDAWTKASK